MTQFFRNSQLINSYLHRNMVQPRPVYYPTYIFGKIVKACIFDYVLIYLADLIVESL